MGHVILGLLLLSPMTLYDINKQFEAGISQFYRASLGGLSGALATLLSKGFVEFTESVERGRSKKTYSITEAGRAEFFGWMSAPIASGNLEVLALSKVYFLGLVADPGERVAILEAITQRVEAEEAGLAGFAQQLDTADIPAEYAQIFRYQRLTLDYGQTAHRTASEWFRRALAEERASR